MYLIFSERISWGDNSAPLSPSAVVSRTIIRMELKQFILSLFYLLHWWWRHNDYIVFICRVWNHCGFGFRRHFLHPFHSELLQVCSRGRVLPLQMCIYVCGIFEKRLGSLGQRHARLDRKCSEDGKFRLSNILWKQQVWYEHMFVLLSTCDSIHINDHLIHWLQ